MTGGLIKISQSTVNGVTVQTVNARDLHTFLDVKRDFSNWIKTQIDRARLVENRDYVVIAQKGEQCFQGVATKKEYFLTTDAGKHIAMMSGADKGFEVRDYFLECERQAKAAPTFQIPQSLPEALRLAADLADENAALKIESEAMRADVDALATIAKADGSLCMTDAAKALQHRPKDLIAFLSNNKWIYRRAGADHWVGYQTRTQSCDLEHKVTTVLRADGSEKITEQVRITPQGLAKLAKLFPPNVREVAA